MNKIENITMALLRFAFLGEKPEKQELSEEESMMLYAMAKKHDIAQIICVALEKLGYKLEDEVKKAFYKQKITVIYRNEIMDRAYSQVSEILEKNKIKYIPLKGIVIKKLYPEEWMRTNSDVDILIHEEDIEKVASMFRNIPGYSVGEKGSHDMGMTTPEGVHVEMHYKFLERNKKADAVLAGAWESAVKAEDKEYCYNMSDELLCFYHVAHMAKHFYHGGCGIRYFIDMWLLDSKLNLDKDALLKDLEECGLVKFDKISKELIDKWLYLKEGSELAKRAEAFALDGGIYGNAEQHIAIKQNKQSKLGYLLGRIFIRRKTLEFFYPGAKKHPVLIPYYMVKRWCKIFDKNKRRQVEKEVRINMSTGAEKREQVATLMKDLEIMI